MTITQTNEFAPAKYDEAIMWLEALKAEASAMSCSCPQCGRSGRMVREQVMQATRQQPARFLGFQGWCVDCQLAITVESAQLALATTQTCDICRQAIEPGDKFHDDGSEIAHTGCVSGWFGRNFGRESLA